MKLMNFDDGNKVRIVLELCDGGDLYHQYHHHQMDILMKKNLHKKLIGSRTNSRLMVKV